MASAFYSVGEQGSLMLVEGDGAVRTLPLSIQFELAAAEAVRDDPEKAIDTLRYLTRPGQVAAEGLQDVGVDAKPSPDGYNLSISGQDIDSSDCLTIAELVLAKHNIEPLAKLLAELFMAEGGKPIVWPYVLRAVLERKQPNPFARLCEDGSISLLCKSTNMNGGYYLPYSEYDRTSNVQAHVAKVSPTVLGSPQAMSLPNVNCCVVPSKYNLVTAKTFPNLAAAVTAERLNPNALIFDSAGVEPIAVLRNVATNDDERAALERGVRYV